MVMKSWNNKIDEIFLISIFFWFYSMLQPTWSIGLYALNMYGRDDHVIKAADIFLNLTLRVVVHKNAVKDFDIDKFSEN